MEFLSLVREQVFLRLTAVFYGEVTLSTLRECPLCGSPVGRAEFSHGPPMEWGTTATVLGGRICDECERGFRRKKIKPLMSPAEKKHNKLYKRFLVTGEVLGVRIKSDVRGPDGDLLLPRHGE